METIQINSCSECHETITLMSFEDALEVVEQRCGSELAQFIRYNSATHEQSVKDSVLDELRKSWETAYCELNDATEAVKDSIKTTQDKRGKKKSRLSKETLIELVEASEAMQAVFCRDIGY